MAAEGMQSHDQSCGNCPTASHPATKKGRINAPILPKPARCAKSDRLLGGLDYRAAHQCHGKIAGPRIFGPAELVRQPFGARCDYLRKSVRALASIRFVGNKFASAWAICPIRLLRQPR